MSFPVIFEHEDACGVVGGRKVKTPAIAATALLLAARGADQILVPCPSDYEVERTARGLELLPAERRACVRVVDKGGDVLRRIREYLQPLAGSASEWPETAFVQYLEDFLYQAALGAKYRAGILADSVEVLRGFVPVIRPEHFRGEAGFRVAEVVALICSYEPRDLEHGSFRLDVPAAGGFSREVWDLLDNAEYRAMVSASGRLGYLKHPIVGLKRLQNVVRRFFAREDAKVMLSLARTSADLAGAGRAATAAGQVIETLGMKCSFRPPFVGLGPARLGVYRVALADGCPDAAPPAGTIMLFERSRAGVVGHSWLNVGEELKLAHEAAQPGGRDEDFVKAKAAQQRFPLQDEPLSGPRGIPATAGSSPGLAPGSE
jgi:hypothetical protein